MMTHPLLIALLEGITEFLPVSSTAHLILASSFFGITLTDPHVKFYLLFIQLGALLAGVVLFSKRILTSRAVFTNICISFVPTAIIGYIGYALFKHLLEGNIPLIAVMLFGGGVIFIWLEKVFIPSRASRAQEKTELTSADAFVIGIAQSIAIIPGVSRSGATIIAGILLGIKKAVIIEYTFLLALPTLGAAVLYDAYKSRSVLLTHAYPSELVMGFFTAMLAAYVTLLIIKKYLPSISLTAFGWYRIMLACVLLIVML